MADEIIYILDGGEVSFESIEAGAKSFGLSLEEYMTQFEVTKKAKGSTADANVLSTKTEASDMVSNVDNGLLDLQNNEPDPKDAFYTYYDGTEVNEKVLIESLRNLKTRLSGKVSSDIYDFTDGKATSVKKGITDQKLLDSYLDKFPNKPIRTYESNRLDEVVITVNRRVEAAKKGMEALNFLKPTEDDIVSKTIEADNIFVPEAMRPTRRRREDKFDQYRDVVIPNEDYDYFVGVAKKKLNLESKGYEGGDVEFDTSEQAVLDLAKTLYIEKKEASAWADNIEDWARNNESALKGTSVDGFLDQQTKYAKIVGDAKAKEITKKSIVARELINQSKTIDAQIDKLVVSEYNSEDEIKAAQTQWKVLSDTKKDLSLKYKSYYDEMLTDVESYEDTGLVLDVVKRAYDIPTIAVGNLLSTTADIVGGVLSIPEWLTVSIGSAISGDSPEDWKRTYRSIGNPTTIGSGGALGSVTDGLKGLSDSMRGGLAKPLDVTKIDSFGDFGYWATDLTFNQLPNLALMIAAPEIALPLMGASAAGGKYQSMMQDVEFYGKKYNGWQLLAAPAIVGAAEYLTEKITLGQLKNFKNVFRSNDVLAASRKYVQEHVLSFKGIKDVAGESFGEGINTLTENIVDINMLGDKTKGYWEGVPNAIASGAFMSGVLFKSPIIAAKLLSPFADSNMSGKLRSNLGIIQKISKELEKTDLSDSVKESLKEQKLRIENDNVKILSDQYTRLDNINQNDKAKLIDIDSKRTGIEVEARAIKKDEALDKDIKETLLKNLSSKYNILNTQKNDILRTAVLNKDVAAIETGAKSIFGGQTEVVYKDDSFAVEDWIVENKGRYSQLRDGKKSDFDRADIYGFMAVDNKTGKTVLVINKQESVRGNKVTTARHEFLHNLLSNTLKDSSIQVNMGFQLIKELKSKTNGGQTMSESFKGRISDYAANGSPASANALLEIETFGDLVDYIGNYLIEDGGKMDAVQFEEIMTLTSEALTSGDLKLSESLLTKLTEFLRRIYRDFFDVDITFDTGKDVLRFIKDYNRSVDNGGMFSDRFRRMGVDGAKGELTKKGLIGGVYKGTARSVKLSKKPTKITPEQRAKNDIIDNLVGPKNAEGDYLMTKKEWDSGGLFDAYEAIINGDAIDGLIMRGIEGDGIYGKTTDDFKEAVKDQLTSVIMNFNPKNNSLIGWINAQLFFKKGTVLNKWKKEAGVSGPSIDVEAGETGSIRELASEENADDIFDLDERAAREDLEDNKKPGFLDTLPFDEKIGENTLEELLAEEVIARVKRNMKLFPEEKSKNRTKTKFIGALSKDIQDNFFKTIRSWMLNHEGGFLGFLTAYKTTLLNNYTTEYLSKNRFLMRRGIEKSVKGQWLRPSRVVGTYGFEYGWVDENGKKLKIDRDNASLRGMESGPDLIRRNRNINNIITLDEFIDYHFKDGSLRTITKQNPVDAMAKQIAVEAGLEILTKDIKAEEGVIYEVISERADLMGIILAENTAAQLSLDIERGNIKHSKKENPAKAAELARELSDKLWDEALGNGTNTAKFINTMDKLRVLSDEGADMVEQDILNGFRLIDNVNEIKESKKGKTVIGLVKSIIKNTGSDSAATILDEIIKTKKISRKQASAEIKKLVDEGVLKITEKGKGLTATKTIEVIDKPRTPDTKVVPETKSKTVKVSPNTAKPKPKVKPKKLSKETPEQAAKRVAAAQKKKEVAERRKIREAKKVIRERKKAIKLNEKIAKEQAAALLEAESEALSKGFNDILESVTGIASQNELDRAMAEMLGEKRKSAIFIPYSHEDFVGLMYPLLAKGEKGEKQLAYLKKNLIDPYVKAEYKLVQERRRMDAEFKALKKEIDLSMGGSQSLWGRIKSGARLSKMLSEKPENIGPFTNEQALRVWLWSSQDMEIPGLKNQATIDAMRMHVMKTPALAKYGLKLRGLLNGKYPAPSDVWTGGNISYDIQQNMEGESRKEAMSDWQFNADAIFSVENMAKLESAFGEKYMASLRNMLTRMKTGKNRISNKNAPYAKQTGMLLDYLNGSVAAIMFLNTKSAILQQISNVNFLNWTDNNPLMAGKAFANLPQYVRDVIDILNSDYLKDRRSGLKINVTESELATAAKSSNPYIALIGLIGQKGFIMTQYGDSFAIATGGATFFRNRFNTYKKEKGEDGNNKYTEDQAKAKASEDFREIAEENQQSSRADKISMQQASNMGRIFLAFANTPAQYARIMKKAALDLKNSRGDAKTNVSKIIYYGAIQNMVFSFLQQGMFKLFFKDDDEEKEEERKSSITREGFNVANGVLDSMLKGAGGVMGSVIATGKNALVKAYDKSQRKRPMYADLSLAPLAISPPIGSKFTKIRQALAVFDYDMWEIQNRGVALNNPLLLSTARFTTATANLPFDRLVIKLMNIKNALNSDLETWQRISSLMGFQAWELGIEDPYAAEEAILKKAEAKQKAKDTRTATKEAERVEMVNATKGMTLFEKVVWKEERAKQKAAKGNATRKANKAEKEQELTDAMKGMNLFERADYRRKNDIK